MTKNDFTGVWEVVELATLDTHSGEWHNLPMVQHHSNWVDLSDESHIDDTTSTPYTIKIDFSTFDFDFNEELQEFSEVDSEGYYPAIYRVTPHPTKPHHYHFTAIGGFEYESLANIYRETWHCTINAAAE
ncbi:MAG: hypothetical protein SNH79_06830 [Rikenellaceae bacterium]